MDRLKAEERLKEEASPGAVKFVMFHLFRLFAQSMVRFSIVHSKDARLWFGLVLVGDAGLRAIQNRGGEQRGKRGGALCVFTVE